MIDMVALQTEITTDPEGIGYAPHVTSGSDSEIARLLNDPTRTVDRTLIPTSEIRYAIVPGEWADLLAVQRDALIFLTAGEEVDVKRPNVRAAFTSAFGPATATRANLVALLTRPGSRAEELWGAGETVSPGQVAQALRGVA